VSEQRNHASLPADDRRKTLTLLRHAKSSWKDDAVADYDRPLNPRGRRDAPEMGRRLQAAGIRPSLIVSSPAKRAWTTASQIARVIGYPREFLQRDADLYLASAGTLMAVIQRQDPDFNHLMICAHNPGLTDLVAMLVPGLTDNLVTAAFVTVGAEAKDWHEFFAADLDLIAYEYPKKIHERTD
jgi:phosphohistidine phosphatase